ncbi:hypothetical protein HGG71_11580 [Rhodobacteraceae bacterium R_SAG2]|nr:hypothetical protein [Rhodobacteraceae bacterium R_SAG2]
MSNDFVNRMWPHALRVSQRTGIDPRLVVAQSALETGYGKHAPGNNYFGIKSHGKSGGNTLATNEVINGKTVRINDSFRGYGDMGQSAEGYADFLLRNPRYKPVMAANGLDAQIAAMGASGYATDPQYASKLRSIASKIPGDFQPEDTPQAIAADAMAALGKTPASKPTTPRAPTISTSGGGSGSLLGGIANDTLEAPMEPEKTGGILGSLFPDMTPDRADQIRLAVNGMLHNPNRGLERRIEGRVEGRREDERAQKAAVKVQQQATRTAQWLSSQPGGEQFAAAIASGALPANDALKMWQAQSKGKDETALVQQYNLAKSQGYQGSFMDYQLELKRSGAANTNVNVNTSDGAPMLGTIPQGYEAIKDPETGTFTMRPVPGGPEDNTEKEAIADEGTRRSGDVVIQDIDRVIAKMEDGGLPVAGMAGGLLSNIPGTDAHDASKLINTIKANVGFDRLQQMRDSSPTGGALGAINQSEMTLLNSALGSLEQSQSGEQFTENLMRLRTIYEEIVHGAGGAAPTRPSTTSDEDLLKKYGGN